MTGRLRFHSANLRDIPLLRALAERIWRASYAELLTAGQIDHMLGWMYGSETIASELQGGVTWMVVSDAAQPVGYMALSEAQQGVVELHKLYLLPSHQGRGLGQAMLQQAQDLAFARGGTSLRLRVHKHNLRARRSYARAGFRVVDDVVSDIGGGFFMDDFILTRPLGPAPLVKICGLSTPDAIDAAVGAGADQIGLVFFPKSPRHVSLDHARVLADRIRHRSDIVALTVNASDREIEAMVEAVRPDWLQLHGHESVERVADLRRRFGCPVMKAIGIADGSDLAAADPYAAVADRLLFDAKPPKGAVLPGGNGMAFDWTILAQTAHPFMLSGGLSAETVGHAVRVAKPMAVDVSSGVERAPGRKDPGLIADFVTAAKCH